VLQNGKRKGADIFMELFQEPLKESMQIIRYYFIVPIVNVHLILGVLKYIK